MVNYSPLGRKMNNEIRISCRKAIVLGISITALFIYVVSKNSCESSKHESDEIKASPIIYAVTPTYARPVQKAELTR